MKNFVFFFFLASTALTGNLPLPPPEDHQKVAVQNSILAKINDDTISILDVKKKMDVVLHQHYPHLVNSSVARYQFYEANWRRIVAEMINQQLMIADAKEKNIPLSDGEVREEIEHRFGPNIMFTLDKIGLTYDEAFKMIKNDLIVQRMSWWFVHAKAMARVTPQDVRQSFLKYSQEHPAFDEWKYRVISVRGENALDIAMKAHTLLLENNINPEMLVSALAGVDPSIQISAEFCAKDQDLSPSYKNALSLLSVGEYSAPVFQKNVARIFYLQDKTFHPAPDFESLSHQLRNELVQKATELESNTYMAKLREHHSFYENIPENFHPFSLQ